MTITEWEQAIQDTYTDQLYDISDALVTLHTWEPFANEFAWSGIFKLQTIINHEIDKRETEKA